MYNNTIKQATKCKQTKPVKHRNATNNNTIIKTNTNKTKYSNQQTKSKSNQQTQTATKHHIATNFHSKTTQ